MEDGIVPKRGALSRASDRLRSYLSPIRAAKPASTESFWGVVSREPLVLYHLGTDPSVMAALHAALGSREAWILRCPDWTEEAPRCARRWTLHVRLMGDRWPNHHYVHLCSTSTSLRHFRDRGADAILHPHNALLDERDFTVGAATEKRFDAVYTAQLMSFKRIHLARDIPHLALLTYHIDAEPGLLESLREQLDESAWVNFDQGEYRRFGAREVADLYSCSRVGLVLSDAEGGNYASCEYFLSGLPLVTTPSEGGRELFYDERFVRVVEPVPEAIAAAVSEFANDPPDPHMIRASTLERMEAYRESFRRLLDRICETARSPSNGQEIWNRGFYSKYTRWQSVDDLMREIDAQAP